MTEKRVTKLLHKLKQIKTYIISNHKKRNIIILTLLAINGISSIFILKKSYANDTYVLGEKGSVITPGTKSGNTQIWPVTHPAFIVQLYKSPYEMGDGDGDYKKVENDIKTVIPYAKDNAMWLCSQPYRAEKS